MKSHRAPPLTLLIIVSLSAIVLFAVTADDSTALLAAQNTLLLAVATCAVSLPLGSLLAFLTARTDIPGRRILFLLMSVMLFIPLYLQVSGWEAGFGKLGWQTLVFGSSAKPWLIGWRAVVWIHAASAIPWVTLIVGLGLRLAEPELEEEALLDGSIWQVFFLVTLPRGVASMVVAAVWVVVVAASEMTVTNIYQISNYADLLHSGLALGDDWSETTLRAAPIMVTLVILLIAGLLLTVRLAPTSRWSSLRRPLTFGLGWCRWPAMILAGIMVLAIVGVPLFNLTYSAGAETHIVASQPVRTWSLGKLVEMATSNPWRHFREEIGWSLMIGVASATLTLIAAAPLAWRATRGVVGALPALFVTVALLATPGPIIALGLIWLLSRPQLSWLGWLYDYTVFAPVLVTTMRSLPLAILVCWYALRAIPSDVLDSAATEGAGSWTRFWRISLPQRTDALGAAWLTALAVAMGDLSATANMLVMPPGIDTISRRIFGLIHFGVMDQVAGVCLALVAMFVLVGGGVIWILRRISRHG